MSRKVAHLRSRSLNIVSLSHMIEGSYRSWDLYTTGQLVDGLQQKKKKKENWFSLNGNGITLCFLGWQFYRSTLYRFAVRCFTFVMMSNFSWLKRLFHLLQWLLLQFPWLFCSHLWVFWFCMTWIYQLFINSEHVHFWLFHIQFCVCCSHVQCRFISRVSLRLCISLYIWCMVTLIRLFTVTVTNQIFCFQTVIGFFSYADTFPLRGFPHNDSTWHSMVVVCCFYYSWHIY